MLTQAADQINASVAPLFARPHYLNFHSFVYEIAFTIDLLSERMNPSNSRQCVIRGHSGDWPECC